LRLPRPGGSPRAALLALRLAVAAALLGWLFHRIGWGEVRDALATARPGFLAGALAATLAAHLVAAVRLRLLARAQDLPASVPELFALNLAAVFYGLFLPGGNFAGTAVRAWKLARGTRRYAATGVTVLIDRLLATVPLCAVGLLFWIVDEHRTGKAAPVLLLAATAAVAALTAGLVSGRARALAARLPGADRLAGPGRPLGGAAQALALVRALPPRTGASLVALTTAATLLGIVATWWLAVALQLPVPFVTLAWVRSVVMLLAMLPVTISGLGVREGALVALLAPYGVPGPDALALALLVFGVTVAAVGVVGGVVEAARVPRERAPTVDERRGVRG
jgi:hypothetical protein